MQTIEIRLTDEQYEQLRKLRGSKKTALIWGPDGERYLEITVEGSNDS
jgi:hypothetical protein